MGEGGVVTGEIVTIGGGVTCSSLAAWYLAWWRNLCALTIPKSYISEGQVAPGRFNHAGQIFGEGPDEIQSPVLPGPTGMELCLGLATPLFKNKTPQQKPQPTQVKTWTNQMILVGIPISNESHSEVAQSQGEDGSIEGTHALRRVDGCPGQQGNEAIRAWHPGSSANADG